MDYLKLYFKVHLKYWYMYLLILGFVIPGFVFSLIFAWIIANLGLNEMLSWITALVLGGGIISLPLLFNNYRVACEIRDAGKSKVNAIFLTLINHVPSYIFCCVIFVVILYLNRLNS